MLHAFMYLTIPIEAANNMCRGLRSEQTHKNTYLRRRIYKSGLRLWTQSAICKASLRLWESHMWSSVCPYHNMHKRLRSERTYGNLYLSGTVYTISQRL